jgi:hypothetical protein
LQSRRATRQQRAPGRDAVQTQVLSVQVLRVRVPASAAVQVFARMTSVRPIPSG